jgi:tape measure domain-containing protein
MSGSNVWKLRLSTEGADQVVRDLRAAATESAAAARAYDTLIKAQPQLATGAERAEQALRRNVEAMRDMRGELNLLGSAAQGATSSLGAFGAALTSPAAAMTALGAASAASVVQIARLGDQYTETMNKLRAATGSAQAAGAVYAELVAMSQQTGASISESAGAFVRFSVAARAIGATNGEVLQLTRTIQQAGLISGASSQEAASGVQQLGQALASGKLQGDELRSILENMPTLAEALAKELGVSVGQLRTMGSEGQLTADRVFQALLRAGVQINQQFTELTPTMGRAFSVLGQAMVEFVGKLDQALGLSQAIARVAAEAAGVVRGLSGAVTPRTPREQAEFDIAASARAQAAMLAEMERLRSGALPPGAQRGTSGSFGRAGRDGAVSREARLAELQAAYQEEIRISEQAQLRLVQVTEEGALAQFNEQRTAAERRAEAQRTAATEAFNTARDALDRERKLRTEHADRIKAIDEGLAAGATDAAEATRLRGLADRALADGLKSLEGPARAVTRATESRTEADREAAAAQREGEAVTRSVRTEAEKFAAEVERLDGLLSKGAITQETYNRAVAAADPALRAAAEASRRIEQENTRTTDRITSFFGDAFARAFEGTGNGFRGLMESFKRAAISTFASIAAQAIIRPIIAPIVQSTGIGQLGIGGGGSLNLGGLFGGSPAQATTQGGGGTDALGSFGTLRQAYNGLTSPGGLGSFFPGGSAVNTGFGGLDALANAQMFGQSATNNAIAYMGGGLYGPATPAAVAGAQASGAGGLTVAGSLGPLAAIGGGAYGVYSGLQRGGVGGYTSAAGGAISAATGIGMLGAAAGLLPALGVLGPIGLGVGALLAIGGALLPGAKPSGQGQLARADLATGGLSFDGLGGKRFSQGNLDAATSAVTNIEALAREIGDKLGGARIGGNAAVGVTNSTLYLDINGAKAQFANNEDGAKALAQEAAKFLIWQFGDQRAAQGPYRGIVDASGGSLEKLSADLQWYEQVYKAFEKTTAGADQAGEAMRAVEAKFKPLVARANELGLSTDNLVKAWDDEWQAAKRAIEAQEAARKEQEAARQRELASLRTALQARIAATGSAADYEARMLASQAARWQAWGDELRSLEERLTALGETTASVAAITQQLRDAQGAEYWRNFASSMQALDQSVIGRILRANGRVGEAERLDFEAGARAQIDALRISLADLGLTAEQAAGKIAETQQAIDAERQARARAANEQIVALDQSVISRILRATGRGAQADVADFEAAAAREVRELARTLDDLGFSAEVVSRKIIETEQAIAAERIALQKRIADEAAAVAQAQARQVLTAGQSIRSFIDAQRATSGPGGVSTAEAFAAAQSQFGGDLSLARAGDQDALARITSTADRLLQAGQRQFASGVDFQAVRSFVLASLESLPATRSYDSLILEELRKLGGAVNVEVGVTMIRSITEQLNALPEAERNRLIQSGEVQRRILQAVAETTGLPLVTPGTITRTVTQAVETTETIQISRSIDDKLSGILNAQLVIGEEQVSILGTLATDMNHLWRYAAGEAGGVIVRSAYEPGRQIVAFARGGVFDSPVMFPMAGGRTGLMGEAGPEAIMPLDRGPDGRLGVRANGGGTDALARMVERLARELAAVQAELARMVRAAERTADATEDTAASNARMMQRDGIVARRQRVA